MTEGTYDRLGEKCHFLYNDGDAGACPVCGSREIRAEKHIFGDRLSVSFMCMKCKAASHFDGFLPEKEDGYHDAR